MFMYQQPTKLHFGVNALEELGSIAHPYGKKCLLVTTPDQPLQALYQRVIELLNKEGIQVVHFDEVEPNPCVEMIERGWAFAKKEKVDFVLAVGGGSSMDSAKAIAFTYKENAIDWDCIFQAYTSPCISYPHNDGVLPLLCVPTTSGTGSQVTQASVLTKGNEKITFFHPDIFAKECIQDPVLMLTLPKKMSAATGFDAFTHAFESYLNPNASDYSRMDSMEAMKRILQYLPLVLKEPDNLTYRTQMCLADTLAGRSLANAGAVLPHPLSEIIGGITHIPHGVALALVFPPFIHHMESSYPKEFETIAMLFGNRSLYEGIQQFLHTIGLAKTMKDFDVTSTDLETMLASPIIDHLPFAPRTTIENILRDAYE